jgi:hypothetical protein
MTLNNNPSTGYIVYVDIVKFSLKKPPAQRDCVEHLSTSAEESTLLKEFAKNSNRFCIHSIGDGFVLITDENTSPKQIIEFIHDLYDKINEYNNDKRKIKKKWNYQVRTGIHLGKFYYSLKKPCSLSKVWFKGFAVYTTQC